MIRIVIADDAPRIRSYFKAIIAKQPDMEVLALCKNGKEAVEAVKLYDPDVVLLDIQMDSQDDGIGAAWEIKNLKSDICIIMLTIHKEDDLIFSSFEAGVTDYILKTEDQEVIIEAIRNAYKGQASMRPLVAGKMRNEFARIRSQQKQLTTLFQTINSLTRSELDIVALYLEGLRYQEIAQTRFIEQNTVRAHVSNILKKFKKKSMKEVAAALKEYDAQKIVKELREKDST